VQGFWRVQLSRLLPRLWAHSWNEASPQRGQLIPGGGDSHHWLLFLRPTIYSTRQVIPPRPHSSQPISLLSSRDDPPNDPGDPPSRTQSHTLCFVSAGEKRTHFIINSNKFIQSVWIPSNPAKFFLLTFAMSVTVLALSMSFRWSILTFLNLEHSQQSLYGYVSAFGLNFFLLFLTRKLQGGTFVDELGREKGRHASRVSYVCK